MKNYLDVSNTIVYSSISSSLCFIPGDYTSEARNSYRGFGPTLSPSLLLPALPHLVPLDHAGTVSRSGEGELKRFERGMDSRIPILSS